MSLKSLVIAAALVAKPLPDGKTAGAWRASLVGPDGVTRKQESPTLPIAFDDCGPGGYSIVLSRLDTDGLQLDTMSTSYTIADDTPVPVPTPATFDGIASVTVSEAPNGAAAAAAAAAGSSTAAPSAAVSADAPAA